jgi:hypothetical protein
VERSNDCGETRQSELEPVRIAPKKGDLNCQRRQYDAEQQV